MGSLVRLESAEGGGNCTSDLVPGQLPGPPGMEAAEENLWSGHVKPFPVPYSLTFYSVPSLGDARK